MDTLLSIGLAVGIAGLVYFVYKAVIFVVTFDDQEDQSSC